MSSMWFYDDPEEWEKWRALQEEAMHIEKEHLEVRVALRDTESALRADPGNEHLQARVVELKRRLDELERQAPWISSVFPYEITLWGVPHG